MLNTQSKHSRAFEMRSGQTVRLRG
jgi:hypothetical protein